MKKEKHTGYWVLMLVLVLVLALGTALLIWALGSGAVAQQTTRDIAI